MYLRRVEIGESTSADAQSGLNVSGSGLIEGWTRWSSGVAGATDIDRFIGNSFVCCCCSLILLAPFCRLRDSIIWFCCWMRCCDQYPLEHVWNSPTERPKLPDWGTVAPDDGIIHSTVPTRWIAVASDGGILHLTSNSLNRLDWDGWCRAIPLTVNYCHFRCDKSHANDSFDDDVAEHQDPVALNSNNSQ